MIRFLRGIFYFKDENKLSEKKGLLATARIEISYNFEKLFKTLA